MNQVSSEMHSSMTLGPYVIATDTEECLIATRLWFDARCGMILDKDIEIDCLKIEEIEC